MGAKYHEASIGKSSDWRTPAYIFDKLGLTFDLDPAYPTCGPCFVPTRKFYTVHDDGLAQPWVGLIWLNGPFGKRRGQVPWLKKFYAHSSGGVALCSALTSADWFHEVVAPNAQLICFTNGKVKFVAADGSIGREPGFGTALLAMGEIACNALRNSGLGLCVVPDRTARPSVKPLTNHDLSATKVLSGARHA
jgi:DNA N-6-adenine-methyltransferase (Dam)